MLPRVPSAGATTPSSSAPWFPAAWEAQRDTVPALGLTLRSPDLAVSPLCCSMGGDRGQQRPPGYQHLPICPDRVLWEWDLGVSVPMG